MNGPQAKPRFRFQLPHWWKARVVPFREGRWEFTEDLDGIEDTELSEEDLTLSWRGHLSNRLDSVR